MFSLLEVGVKILVKSDNRLVLNSSLRIIYGLWYIAIWFIDGFEPDYIWGG